MNEDYHNKVQLETTTGTNNEMFASIERKGGAKSKPAIIHEVDNKQIWKEVNKQRKTKAIVKQVSVNKRKSQATYVCEINGCNKIFKRRKPYEKH